MIQEEFESLIARLPYTKPLIMVSGVQNIEENLKISAWHEYHSDDILVRSHLDGRFIAGILITEQICQTALLLLINQFKGKPLPSFYLGKVRSDYLFPVSPGILNVIVEIIHQTPLYIIFHGTAWVDKTKVAMVKGGVKVDIS